MYPLQGYKLLFPPGYKIESPTGLVFALTILIMIYWAASMTEISQLESLTTIEPYIAQVFLQNVDLKCKKSCVI